VENGQSKLASKKVPSGEKLPLQFDRYFFLLALSELDHNQKLA
jgi:hypothetical protein